MVVRRNDDAGVCTSGQLGVGNIAVLAAVLRRMTAAQPRLHLDLFRVRGDRQSDLLAAAERHARLTFAGDYLRGRILTFLGILLLSGLFAAFSASPSSAATPGARIGLAISRAKLTTSS